MSVPAANFRVRDRVRYVPGHANGDAGHPDCEDGEVSSVGTAIVFVRFDKKVRRLGWAGTTAEACSPEDLTLLSDYEGDKP